MVSIVCCRVYPNKIEIASDSIEVYWDTQLKGATKRFGKLFQVNEMTIGTVGTSEEGSLMARYCETHLISCASEGAVLSHLSDFASWQKGILEKYRLENNYIFVIEDKAFSVEGFCVQEIIKYHAIGAGMDYALAALYLGHDVDTAVRVACELCIYCELPLHKVVIKK